MNAKRASGTRRTTTTRRRRSTTTSSRYRRRRRPGLSSTVGSAIGMLAVTTLLNLSWPARIGLLVLVLVVGMAYMLWRHRAEIAPGADGIPEDAAAPPTPPVSYTHLRAHETVLDLVCRAVLDA